MGEAEPKTMTEFQQLCKAMQTWMEFTKERDRRRDRDILSSSHIVQGVNVSLNDFMKLAPLTFTGMNN